MKQLELFSITESDRSQVSGAAVAPDTKIQALQRFCTRNLVTPYVEKYTPARRKVVYYRVSWREGRRMKHLHIPGGNTNSQLAQYRAKQLQEMIDRGAELEEIVAAVNTYRGI